MKIGNYTLTLLNVVPYTTYFSDPPEQIAGFAPMESFIAGFNWRCPNAALSLGEADENEDTVILAISSPRYDNQTGTLIYAARILKDLVSDRLSYHISRADAGIPEEFGWAELFLGGCGSAARIAVSAQNNVNISENVTPDDETAGWPSYTFVQEAANGTFVKNADGNYTLTLYNVVPYTTYFSDPPEQIAGFSPMESFLYGFNWNYPNAALSLVDAEEDNDTVILAITSPRYDNQTRTLIYTARILEDLVDDRFNRFSDRFSYHISRADAGIPERFGRAELSLGGCGSAASIAVSAQNDTNISENMTLDDERAGWPSFSFVQEAANGTFVKNEDGNYTLTLYNVVPYTTYFSDPPEQIAGFSPMESFLYGFNWNYPNAALSIVDAEEDNDTVILAITSPRYDNQTGTLTYTSKILEDPRDDRLSYHISRADAGIPERFGQAKIILGGCGPATWKCGQGRCGYKEEEECGEISCSCCWDGYCEPCGRDCYYKTKCREEFGGVCGHCISGNTCGWGAPPDGGQIVKQHILRLLAVSCG
jgi:hypothetical protein